jgi:hypothetical protein
MGFPYLAPLPPWTVDIMIQRENNPVATSFKNPWAVLTSGALVAKSVASADIKERLKQLENLINGELGEGEKVYKGCIISNNINNTELSYSTQETIIGIDFEGKPIKVEGEKARKVSTPIIESIDIDTDGANNTLKTAKIAVRCFTLKQLEMFELFFLKPGMNVLIEFGDASLLKTALFPIQKSKATELTNKKNVFNKFKDGTIKEIKTFSKLEEALVSKNESYDDFCKNFSQYFRSDTEAIAKYLEKVERSLGSYDLVAGKVTEYSFSISPDGTYEVTFEVSQGNQVSMAIPHNPKSATKAKTKQQSNNTDFLPIDQIKELMIADLNLGDGMAFKSLMDAKHPDNDTGKTWENDFFNFLKINKQQKDTVASDKAYVSLRFVLKILMNFVLGDKNIDQNFFEFNIQEFTGESTKKKIFAIPVTSNKNIISSNTDVIFPTNELPKFVVDGKDKNEIGISKDDRIKGLINGYDFHTQEPLIVPNVEPKQIIKAEGSDKVGNALNIFLNYETVTKAWNSARSRIDFLENILAICNQNSYGMFTLVFGISENNGKPTIIDAKRPPTDKIIEDNSEIYRFKPTTINSNVLEFSFNFEMSNLVAGRQIFNSGKFIAEAKSKKEGTKTPVDTNEIHLPPEAYRSIDNSNMGNADGWYSINNVEKKSIEARFERLKTLDVDLPDPEEKKPETATTEANTISQIISDKSISFLMTKSTTALTPLIFKDPAIITKKIFGEEKTSGQKKPTLSPIDITLTIDGFSGFTPGQYFNVDGIPEIYNQIGVFQITNTKHTVSNEGWKTTIEASHMLTPKKK